MRTTSDVPQDPHDAATVRTERPENELCSGCWLPAHEVGFIETATILVQGRPITVRYCAGCLEAHQSAQRAIAAVREARRPTSAALRDLCRPGEG